MYCPLRTCLLPLERLTRPQATTTIDDPLFVQVWNLLDIVLTCSERSTLPYLNISILGSDANPFTDQCDGLLIFYLAEELLDSQSIDGCRRVFDYLESRRERLVAVSMLHGIILKRVSHAAFRAISSKTLVPASE